jgi:phage terminase large subunit-like protein
MAYRLAEIDLDATWRPVDLKKRPRCRYTFRDKTCTKTGAHYCESRADRAVAFFSDLLVHTKGAYVNYAFTPKDWQEYEILRPLFGEVTYTEEHNIYVRRYRIAHIVVARKNGKSELAAGLLLYMLVGDDEEAAECYGAAADTKQAGKVFEPANRMRMKSPVLSRRLKLNKQARRIYDEKSGSIYQIITADAKGELGHNPHGFNLDEVLSQRDNTLWEAMTTAVGARTQELLFTTTTETNDPSSFGADLIDEAEAVQADPASNPHTFAYVRKMPRSDDELKQLHKRFEGHPHLPVSLDVWDERNWKWPNPALGDFKSMESMRRQRDDAIAEPTKENGFRQYQCNQRVSQVTRWMPLHLWDACTQRLVVESDLHGRKCFAGLDLAASTDIASIAYLFAPEGDDEIWDILWRCWAPEVMIPKFDKYTGG